MSSVPCRSVRVSQAGELPSAVLTTLGGVLCFAVASFGWCTEAPARMLAVSFPLLSACRVLGTGVLMTSLTVLLRGPDVPGGPIPIGSFNALKKRLLQLVRLCACMVACVFCKGVAMNLAADVSDEF